MCRSTTRLPLDPFPRARSGRSSRYPRYAPLDQLCLSPQCGFSSTVEGNALTQGEQWAKLALIVDVAAEVWGSG
jgi:5-methyltetrahydropteroyltriglutamate--homocysteine methyltransferase